MVWKTCLTGNDGAPPLPCCMKVTVSNKNSIARGPTSTNNNYCLTRCPEHLHFTPCGKYSHFREYKKYKSSTVVPKAYPVRAAGLRPSKRFSRSPAGGWTRAARCCLVFLACLAHLLGAAQQHQHTPGFAAHAMVHEATPSSTGVTAASFHAEQSGVPCALHGTRAGNGNGNAPPCPHGDCPFCPCPCCASLHAAIGIVPQEAARADYAAPFSTIAPPPVRLGSAVRFATIAGQPRAPPLSI